MLTQKDRAGRRLEEKSSRSAVTPSEETTDMKAVGYKKSLPIEAADALIDFEAAKPEPRGRDICVAVKAVSANPVDYKVRKRAAPPEGEIKILGYDAAGMVDAVGPEVTLFKPGDEVFYAGSILRQEIGRASCRERVEIA